MSKNHQKLILLFLVFTLITACEARPADHPVTGNVPCATCHSKNKPKYSGPTPSRPVGQKAALHPDLTKTKWLLVSFSQLSGETPVEEGSNITLSFYAAGQAGGSGSCNVYSVPYTVQGNSLSFGKLLHSAKLCQPEGTNQQEQDYFQAIESAISFEVVGNWLTIQYADGHSALNLIKFPGS